MVDYSKYNDYDRYVYEKELNSFLPDEFIDFHTHVDKLSFEKWGESNGGSTWVSKIYTELPVDDLLEWYNIMFPNQKVTPLIFGACGCNIDKVNDYVRDEKEIHGFPTLYRTSYDMPADEIEEKVKAGGFLGLKPYLSNCPPYLPAKEIRIYDFLPHEHLEIANKNGWIIMLHIPRDGRLKDPVNIAQLMEIEKKYPNAKLVVAHIGRAYAKEDIGNAVDSLGKTKNMMFDFTANVCDDAIRACIEAVGSERLIFGSDMPVSIMRMYRIVDENGVYYNVVPRGIYGDVEGEPHMKESDEENITIMMYEQIRALKRVAIDLKLSDKDVENIMANNAKRLIEAVK